MKSEVYNADNVEFYYDLTYKKDGETHYERQIWEQAYDILDKAEDFFLMDIFVFNDFLSFTTKDFHIITFLLYNGKIFARKEICHI